MNVMARFMFVISNYTWYPEGGLKIKFFKWPFIIKNIKVTLFINKLECSSQGDTFPLCIQSNAEAIPNINVETNCTKATNVLAYFSLKKCLNSLECFDKENLQTNFFLS